VSGERISVTEVVIPPPSQHRWDVHVPMTTILKLVGSGLGLWAVYILWSEFLLFLIAVLLAVTLYPAVRWMEERRFGRGLSVIVIAVLGIGLFVAFVLLILPPLTTQVTYLTQNLPDFRVRVSSRISARYPAVQKAIHELFESPFSPRAISMFQQSFAWGRSVGSALVVAAVVLILTLYLLLDGRCLYAWLLAFAPRAHRERLAATTDEVSKVVQAYVSGQFLVALLFAFFTAILLTILRVPAAVPLAVIAGFCDIIPVLGILLATVPAVLLALAVSPATALAVLVAYVSYHLFETYFLLPRIYGNKLKISTLSVLLALLAGGRLQGIIGIVLALPLVAAYPIIERHWLRGYLQARVLTDHKALAKAAETGSEVAINAVLHGEKHASEGTVSPGGKK
jgi:predicted PurR-regulated permease PerM